MVRLVPPPPYTKSGYGFASVNVNGPKTRYTTPPSASLNNLDPVCDQAYRPNQPQNQTRNGSGVGGKRPLIVASRGEAQITYFRFRRCSAGFRPNSASRPVPTGLAGKLVLSAPRTNTVDEKLLLRSPTKSNFTSGYVIEPPGRKSSICGV